MSFLTGSFYYEIPNQVRNDSCEGFVLWGSTVTLLPRVPRIKKNKTDLWIESLPPRKQPRSAHVIPGNDPESPDGA